MPQADPGSFRDPASRVVLDHDRAIRLLDDRGLQAWQRLSSSDFFSRATSDGRLIESEQIEPPGDAAGAIQHPRLIFISYPYEWTFNMLKDAALLQLDLLTEALNDGLTIKDATPFNIQFVDCRPVFIDIGSFEAYSPGEPWIGYRQFTRQFLFPLLMRAWAGIPFQPWLRGDMEGPTAAQMKQILPLSKRLKPAAMMHVSLQARMEDRMSGTAVRGELKQAGFSAELILANVKKLRSLVESLDWQPESSDWSDYQACDHVGRDREAKGEFLRSLLESTSAGRVLDLGANDGYFSKVAGERGAHAIAVDGDELVLDSLYRRSGGENLSVVVSDLNNPSPSQGWAGAERQGLAERAKPDAVVAYGLIHHLIYTSSIPPESVVAWLRSFDAPVALEFVAPDDEMVAKLTANKLEEELHPGRSLEEFTATLETVFDITSTQALEGGSRTLFALSPKS